MLRDGLRERRDKVGGLEIFARVYGGIYSPEDRPIVLVHGLSMSSRYLAPLAVCLAEKHYVCAPDLPGFGRSQKPWHVFTISELADFLEAWMEAIGLGEVVLVGNSLGCQIIVAHALRHPGRASALVLSGLTPDPRRRAFLPNVARLALALLREPLSFYPVGVWDYLSAGLRRTLISSHDILHDPIEEKLPRVNVPALVVRGERDPIISQRWAEEAVRLLPQGRLAVIPGAGHAINWSFAEPMSRVMEAFFNGLLTAVNGFGERIERI